MSKKVIRLFKWFEIFFINFVILSSLFNNTLKAQKELEYNLEEVVITTDRRPISFSQLGRSIKIITPKELEGFPVNSIQDILKYSGSVDIKQRGPEGIQADVSIRGGSFEQTLVLIDGIKLSDPQTSHHLLNLPVSLEDVERIEILKGQGSLNSGANAFSGVINIITKKSGTNKTSIDLAGGENGYYHGSFNSFINLGNLSNRITISKQQADGYRKNTGFTTLNFSYGNSIRFNTGTVNMIFGYNEKDFGANSFYTTRFPDQAEKTITKIAGISSDLNWYGLLLSPKVSWRRNNDDFVLDKFDHDFYRNLHRTDVFSGELQLSKNYSIGETIAGIEYTLDDIESTNLGKHNRNKKGAFVEQRLLLNNNLSLSFGGFVYNYSSIGWKFWPGIDFAYNIRPNMKFIGSVGKAFRIPTYTELFYNDPATEGNPDLRHEETVNYELGIDYRNSIFTLSAAVFRKEGKDLIDWVRNTSLEKWNVRNIASVNTNGFEIETEIDTRNLLPLNFLEQINISYTYLNSNKKTEDLESRYVLEYLKHQLIGSFLTNMPWEIKQSWFLRFEDRINVQNKLLVDTQLSKSFTVFDLYLKATNIFNVSHEDIVGVPLSGRWIIAGIKYTML